MAEKIIRTEYSEVMQKSYIDYSMSVITARALPDVRDGLKPVQRRVLYAMDQLGLNYDKPHRKSARIVGDTMGKYHPHGDSSIYETLVVLSQDFKKGMALVDGHGNFGSIEGDGAAAMRYTEAKLKKFTQDVYLADLDKNVVDFVPNFDTMKFNNKRMEDSAKNGFTNATDAADYLVKKGVPFREAHGIVGQLVLMCIEKNIALDDLSLDEYKAVSPVFDEDIYEAISLQTCVDKRLTLGAPGPEVMNKVIAIYDEYMKEN
jgi:DNA gyrase subunit A